MNSYIYSVTLRAKITDLLRESNPGPQKVVKPPQVRVLDRRTFRGAAMIVIPIAHFVLEHFVN